MFPNHSRETTFVYHWVWNKLYSIYVGRTSSIHLCSLLCLAYFLRAKRMEAWDRATSAVHSLNPLWSLWVPSYAIQSSQCPCHLPKSYEWDFQGHVKPVYHHLHWRHTNLLSEPFRSSLPCHPSPPMSPSPQPVPQAGNCEFHTTSVQFLGYHISNNSVKMDQGKVHAPVHHQSQHLFIWSGCSAVPAGNPLRLHPCAYFSQKLSKIVTKHR